MFALYPHMNVRRNISYPLLSQGMSRAEAKNAWKRSRASSRSRVFWTGRLADCRAATGSASRLGRAIVRRPKAFFMDEPLGALDAEFREHMAEELRALHDRIGATTVYVTHDQLEAMQMGDKIVVMNHGVVEQFGKPQDIYDWPATKFVAKFIGSPAMNFFDFDGMIGTGSDAIELSGHRINIPVSRQGLSGKLTMGVRPEHIRFFRCVGLSRTGACHRISRHDADRHDGDPQRGDQGRAPRQGNRQRQGRSLVSNSTGKPSRSLMA